MKKKRAWFKRSSLILSAVVSMAAPGGKTNFPSEGKVSKACKKSKSPHSSVAGDGECASDPPFSGMLAARSGHRKGGRVMPPRPLAPPPAPTVCNAAPVEEVRRALPARPPMEEVRRALPTDQFAWKNDISTTVFWIGETPTTENPVPNHQSSWDAEWAKHYGGFDNPDPEARKGFLPADFTPKQNPFYVALPYNDIAEDGHKEGVDVLIPWFKQAFTSKWKSVCKGRWIAIRKGDRVCYAQWEDAGPFTTNDADYVFGNARPKPNPNHDAGLDVSPAVRDYLGLDGQDMTDWKFVEVDEIPLGPWADHGENNHFVMARKIAERLTVAAAIRPGSSESKRSARSTRRSRTAES